MEINFLLGLLGGLFGYVLASLIGGLLDGEGRTLNSRVKSLEDKLKWPLIETGMDKLRDWVKMIFQDEFRKISERRFSDEPSLMSREIAELQQLAIDLGYKYQKGGRWVKNSKKKGK